MANDKKMVEDINSDLSPQYYNPVTGKYEYLHGADGVSFTGNHVMTDGGIWVPQRGSDDGSVNTRLTGSIVELYKSDSVEMESNSRINLIDITEMKKKHVIASIRARDSHDFLLDVDWRTSATGSVGYSVGAEQLIKSDNELSSKTENYISTKTNVARFRLENNSDEIQRYLSIVIMGVD